jgi:eukaryotic-like serine/threonine-protein kinase
MMTLGAFALETQVGGGGHGLVWRGRHLGSNLPVAIKLLPPSADGAALHGLKNEVQAVARLHHPHIVAILDTGVVDTVAIADAAAVGQTLLHGSPWVAYELASGGDLASLALPLPWPALVDVLRTLLPALAHAHARDVVHRDLKPANVLLCTDGDARPGVKLTDFGLASWGRDSSYTGGTPHYMAPEQFDGDPRDVGPWTDLYSLGVLATVLATGRPVFPGATWRELERQHREVAPPPLVLGADVPTGFVDIVSRLLAKDPAGRFRCAADVDAALAALEPGRPAPPSDRLPPSLATIAAAAARTRDTAALAAAMTLRREGPLAPDAPTEALVRVAPRPTTRSSPSSETTRPPSVGAVSPPSSWRSAGQGPLPDLRLVEAGLSLWGLRPVPLVGRRVERDALWQSLLRVHGERRARLACLRGPSGVGKSRLVEWVGHRAAETGAARVLRATWTARPTPGDGFAGLVARLIGVSGLEAREARRRAATWRSRWLGGDEPGVDELCALAGIGDGAFATLEERQAALVRLLAQVARERPLVIWLDDLQWGGDGIAFVERVLDDAPELPVLFIATVVDELLEPERRTWLDRLVSRPIAMTLPLQPLDEESHDELCHLLLGGEGGALVEDLRRRTEGNPMFAVHVVGDWVQRGLLTVTPRGLVLREGETASLPGELFRLWDDRLDAALATLPANAGVGLEIAAVLGGSVDLVEWETASRLPRATLDGIIDALVGAGLARRSESGFTFVHVLVRSAVERRSGAAGRLERAHVAVAEALQVLWGTDSAAAAARIGRHLLAAGAVERAASLLLRAARAAIDDGEVFEAAALLADWQRACQTTGLSETHLRATPGMVLQARIAAAEGRHAEARDVATRVQQVIAAHLDHDVVANAPRPLDPRLFIQAAIVEGRSAAALGDPPAARAAFERARQSAADVDDRTGLAQALLGLGDVAWYLGQRHDAAGHYHAAADLLRAAGRKHDVAQLLWSLGYVAFEEGHFDDARRLFKEQRSLCRASRIRVGEANAENALGELARRLGNLPDAEAHYRAALRIAARCGLSRRSIFRTNLAHVRIACGDIEGAAELVAEVLDSPLGRSEPVVAMGCWWILAWDAARRADLHAWDRAADAALGLWRGTLIEDDLAVVAGGAGEAMRGLDEGRAERALAFARAQRAALGGSPP